MKKELVNILVCPVCKGKLTLTVAKAEGDEVVNGSLYCPQGEALYPIVDTIPNLLPPAKHL